MKTVKNIWSIHQKYTTIKEKANIWGNILLSFFPSMILAACGKFNLWEGAKFLLYTMWQIIQEHPFTAIFRIATYPILLPFFAIISLPLNLFYSEGMSSIFKDFNVLQTAGAIALLPIGYLLYNEHKSKNFINPQTCRRVSFKLFNTHALTNNEYKKLLTFVENYKKHFPQADLSSKQAINSIISNIIHSQDAELLGAVAKSCPKDSELFSKLEQAAAQCKPWPLDNTNSLLWIAAKNINGGKLKVRHEASTGVTEIYVDKIDNSPTPEKLSHLQAIVDRAAPFARV